MAITTHTSTTETGTTQDNTTETSTTETGPSGPELEAAIGVFAERVTMAALGGLELLTIDLGNRLGLYAAMVGGPVTPPELARRAGIDTRYAREWLEQQTTAGIVSVDAEPADGSDPDARVFRLGVAHQACLLDPDSLASVAPLATLAAEASRTMGRLVDAYRSGRGITFGEYGDGIRAFQSAANRPQFLNLLASDWLPAMPDVVARLESPDARVADVGCGCGWSSIALALAYPNVTVDGFDLDEPSIAEARANAAARRVDGRARFAVRDAARGAPGHYDLVCCFEALHDMPRPVDVLRAMRSMLTPAGTVLVVDERAADTLTESDPDPMQRLFYAASVLHCLPVGRSGPDSAATGTVMRVPTFERYATEAGFTRVTVLPIDHPMFRFYRLDA